jgi:F-type H+-transporting ATPase subunit b
MKRILGVAAFALIIGLGLGTPRHLAAAQEPTTGDPKDTGKEGTEKEPAEVWKWANFVILAGGLGFLIAKKAPAFFDARAQQIVQDIHDSHKLRADAEARAADVDRRLANLDAEIAALRTESKAEIAAETERLNKHTSEEIAKIQAHAKQEIESAGKAARMELKRTAAELAISLAERKIRARMTPETQDNLVRSFVQDLEPPRSEAHGD